MSKLSSDPPIAEEGVEEATALEMHVDMHHAVLEIIRKEVDELYIKYPFDYILDLSTMDRHEFRYSSPTLTYSEVKPEALYYFLIHLDQQKLFKFNPTSTTFVDLGCGIGRALIAAHKTNKFYSCTGIELLPRLFQVCTSVLHEYTKVCRAVDETAAVHVDYLLGDATYMEESWSSADVVFVNSTSFDKPMMRRISNIANKMKPGSCLIALCNRLQSDYLFELVQTMEIETSFGVATANIYERNMNFLPDIVTPQTIRSHLQSILDYDDIIS